jgi:hypothetical protein
LGYSKEVFQKKCWEVPFLRQTADQSPREAPEP